MLPVNPLTPDQVYNSPYCQLYNSYDVSSENYPKLIFFFILITYLVDIVSILYGEILSWSFMGVKGLNSESLNLISGGTGLNSIKV